MAWARSSRSASRWWIFRRSEDHRSRDRSFRRRTRYLVTRLRSMVRLSMASPLAWGRVVVLAITAGRLLSSKMALGVRPKEAVAARALEAERPTPVASGDALTGEDIRRRRRGRGRGHGMMVDGRLGRGAPARVNGSRGNCAGHGRLSRFRVDPSKPDLRARLCRLTRQPEAQMSER